MLIFAPNLLYSVAVTVVGAKSRRAFMGAGARSVLVSLWAIDDKATFEFMNCFYLLLTQGKRSSESLNLATKSLRESKNFNKIKFWAPLLLIGDDVTFEFSALE